MNAQNADMNGDFSFDTIKDFDSHIELSIPNYKHIWELIESMATYFIVENSNVYDLGCSTGQGLKLLSYKNNIKNVNYIGFDVSENLLKQKNSTAHYSLYLVDITNENILFPNSSLSLMIFTLQFIPTSKKVNLLKRVYDGLISGGAFILTEKTITETGKMQDIFTFSYYDFKIKSFSRDEILKKQHDLRFIMKNNTDGEILELLNLAGFKYIEPFFQSLHFKGYLCLK